MSEAPHPEDLGESGKLVISHAQRFAAELGSEEIEGAHLFLGVVALEDAILRRCFTAQALDLEAIAKAVRDELAAAGGGDTVPPVGESAIRALQAAQREASAQAKPLIEAPHILMGVLKDDEGLAARRLDEAGADRERLHQELRAMLDQGKWSAEVYKERRSIQQPGIGTPSEVLESLGRDLTAAAEAGELSPIIGRDRETLELIQILCAMKKNNAVLVGEAGVGKTAIVEGLAQRIVAGQVPDQLKGTRIRTLEVGSLVAGTMYRGQFEEKLKRLIDALRDRRDVILFIDEMHMLIGAGRAEGVVMDAADMLKPVLTEGSLKVIGATTTEEFRKHIESDPALMRRFQEVVVGETSREATLAILEGLRPKYEEFHGVTIEDEALAACVDLSLRHMHDRFLPDKALDLLDRACTQEKLGVGMREWMPSLAPRADGESPLRDTGLVVEAGEIAEVVSILLEIPIAELTTDERHRLLKMGEALKRRVIGQDHAVDAIAQTILAVRMGMKEPERPYGVFLFLGPTGVGKTTLAEEVAAYLFGGKDEVIRLDMSEYAEQHTVSGLIGAPPGYVGWAEGGRLTNAVRAKPYSVVLLDEMEKAHPDVWNIFLQVFEDGRLTDNAGRLVDFRNTVIIMTSNVGARQIQASRPIGFALEGAETELSYEDVCREVARELKRVFAPEFLNRIDEVLVFRPLSRETLRTIIGFVIEEMIPLELELSDAALEFLVEQSYEPALGARPARRAIQRLLRNPLSLMLARDEIAADDTVSVGFRKGALTFRKRTAKAAWAAERKAAGRRPAGGTSVAAQDPTANVRRAPVDASERAPRRETPEPASTADLRHDAKLDEWRALRWLAGQVEAGHADDLDLDEFAAQVFGDEPEPSALWHLRDVLGGSDDEPTRLAAGRVLYSRSTLGESLLAAARPALRGALARGLRSGDPRACAACLWAVFKLGGADTHEVIARVLPESDKDARFEIVRILGFLGDRRATPMLVEALARERSPKIRSGILWALGMLADQAALQACIDALGDPDAKTRGYAAWALGAIRDPAALTALREALSDPDREVRKWAEEAVGLLESLNGPRDE